MNIDSLIDSGYLPLPLLRLGIRRQLAQREALITTQTRSLATSAHHKQAFVAALKELPIAVQTAKANEQHYEVGAGVLKGCLGGRVKYSCCFYEEATEGDTWIGGDGRGNGEGVGGGEGLGGGLDEAEERMLELYVQRSGVGEGMDVLDLGCGWGSLCLFLAARFPTARITAFSNSSTQRAYIEEVASNQLLTNLTVLTGDIATHEFPAESFDRVLSIELFEHMKNYELLMAKVARSLRPGGKLFVHHFAHAEAAYDFEDGWMSEHFFTGGTMMSRDLLLWFQRDLKVSRSWWVNGRHYAKTCEDWLAKMNRSREEIWPHLEETYGKEKAQVWFYRWQVFYLACAELFAWRGGERWGVVHYLFEKPE